MEILIMARPRADDTSDAYYKKRLDSEEGKKAEKLAELMIQARGDRISCAHVRTHQYGAPGKWRERCTRCLRFV